MCATLTPQGGGSKNSRFSPPRSPLRRSPNPLLGFSSDTANQKKQPLFGADFLERVKGIEPSYSAWEAAALPLSYTRKSV